MELSIIIVNFNTKDLVVKCIESIKKSETEVSYEVIVVDNGSDNPMVSSRDYTLIKNRKNLGFAKASNQGIRIAKGKYILLLNSDTLVKKGAIDKLINFAEKNPDAGVVGPRLLNINGTSQDSVFHFPTAYGAIKEYWFGQRGNFGLYVPNVDRPIEVDSVIGATFLITPEARKRIGLLNEKYFMYFEDLDYCRRVWRTGLKVYYLPSAEIIHYHGASGRNIVKPAFQWRRLIPSSKIYNGVIKHYLINSIIWSGQKWQKFLRKQK